MKLSNKQALWTSLTAGIMVYLVQLIALVDHYFGGFSAKAHDANVLAQFEKLNFSAHWPLLSFVLITLCCFLLFSGLIYYVALAIGRRDAVMVHPLRRTLQLWAVGYVAVLIINSYQYPNSLFAIAFFSKLGGYPTLAWLAHFFAWTVLAIFVVSALTVFFYKMKHNRVLRLVVLVVALILLLSLVVSRLFERAQSHATKKSALPNIVMLIYCSFKGQLLTQLPHFSAFAKQSVNFSRVLNPTARSGPSTYAILSGLYPASSQYFFNLNWADPKIAYDRTLPMQLKKLGYHTAFITNINLFRRLDAQHNWGFETIKSPPTSVYALALSKINDLPLSNLLFDFSWSAYLFPYNYNNADDSVHYSPAQFTFAVRQFIRSQAHNRPLFLVINDETLHHPYQMRAKLMGSDGVRYAELADMTDASLGFYMQFLKKAQLLNNTVLILTADHGEAHLNDPSTQVLFKAYQRPAVKRHLPLLRKHKLGLTMLMGHGVEAIDTAQYHIPLFFRFYGHYFDVDKQRKVDHLLSAVDITPTILSLLGQPAQGYDGQSLLPALKGQPLQNHVVFTQTGILLQLPKTQQQIKDLAFTSAKKYRLFKNGAFAMKQSVIDDYKQKIHFSAYYHHFQLVYYPAFKDKKAMVPTLWGLTDFDKSHVFLLTEQEFDALLQDKGQAKAVSQQLDVSVETIKMVHAKLMAYVKRALSPSDSGPV